MRWSLGEWGSEDPPSPRLRRGKQRSEGGGQRAEGRGRKSEGGGRKSEDRRQRAEDGIGEKVKRRRGETGKGRTLPVWSQKL